MEFLFFFLTFSYIFSQISIDTTYVKFTNEKIIIDGLENESSWKNADLKTGYWQWFPTDTLKASKQTEIKFLFDDDNFYVFDGTVRKLDCTVRRHIYDNLNNDQKDKVFAGVNSEFTEIIWLYPSKNSDDCDSYVIFSPEENYWTIGSCFWTTFNDRTIFGNTITSLKGKTGKTKFSELSFCINTPMIFNIKNF